MNPRRVFLSDCTVLATLLLPSLGRAQATVPLAGVQFVVLDKPAPVESLPGKIEVIEFFWYNCPHCHALESELADWLPKLPKGVAFKRVPVAFRDDFVPQQRLYYALEAMGLVAQLHARVFAAIHGEKQDLSRGDAIADWVARQGVNKTQFLEHFHSFSVATQASRAVQLQSAYKVDGVPAFGVAGRFYTNGELARSMDRMLQVVDYLIAEVRRGR